MAASLATNTKAALTDLNITSVTEWTDSTVVLLWLREQRNNKIFVEKKGLESWIHRVKVRSNKAESSRHSRDSKLGNLWLIALTWFSNILLRHHQPTVPTTATQVEFKTIKEIISTTAENTFAKLLEKHELYKFFKITAWIKRFINNCQKA